MKPNKAFQVKIQKSKVKSETPKNVAGKALLLFGFVPEPNLRSTLFCWWNLKVGWVERSETQQSIIIAEVSFPAETKFC